MPACVILLKQNQAKPYKQAIVVFLLKQVLCFCLSKNKFKQKQQQA
jgi:hypothetical protein